jgi:hypothetical protein
MPEQIDNQSLAVLLPGGHTWLWAEPALAAKELTTIGTTGAARTVLGRGARRGVLCGRDGGPAVVRLSGADRDAADQALSDAEAVVDAWIASGEEVAWEDDQGHSGSFLVIEGYQRVGPRRYGQRGDGNVTAWQSYTLRVADLAGGDGT